MVNRRLIPIFIVILGLVFAGLLTLQGPLLAFALPFLVYLLSGVIYRPDRIQLEVERTLSADRVGPQAPIKVLVKITNHGSPIGSFLVEDDVPAGLTITEGQPRTIVSLDAGETLSFTYTLNGSRGAYHLAGLQTIAGDHLGIVRRHHFHPLSNRILILPQAFQLPEVSIRPRRTRVFPGLIPARKGGAGVEFFGVREYQSGDPMRWINERASARHDQAVFVNEFEQDRAVDVGIILDCRVETNQIQGSTQLLESGTQGAATLAETFLKQGNRVGLLIYGGGRNWVHPGYGKLQRERIFQVLAGVRLFESYVTQELTHLPTRLFPARSQLVFVSSLLFQDLNVLAALRAHGYQLLIISPDPISLESKILGPRPGVDLGTRIARVERDFMLRQLLRTGARVFEWDVDQPFQEAAQFALKQRPAWGLNMGVVRA